MKHGNFQEVYFLGDILQGAMDLHSEASLLRAEDGLVTCKWCSQVVLGSSWKHISWGCSHLNAQKLKPIEDSNNLIPEAVEGMLVDPAFWLRGLPSVELPDPLGMEFTAMWAGPDGLFEEYLFDGHLFDVEGLLLRGDGSGGDHTQDSRIRR